jgi:NAD(P)-dependent dehydrogenase (short-subunit alcohol dehydrogenase family)
MTNGCSYVRTPVLEQYNFDNVMKKELEKTPVGRIAEMDEIADCITFLASPQSSYMHGSALIVDG